MTVLIVVAAVWLAFAVVVAAGLLGARYSSRIRRSLYGEPLSDPVLVGRQDHRPQELSDAA